jgi:hypothetical protein
MSPAALTPPWRRRALTEGEQALGQALYGDTIDWPAVGLFWAPAAPHGAMVPLGLTIVHGARWPAPADFAHAPLAQQGWFIHELAHVWQAARGEWLAGAKLFALGRGAYRVALREGRSFFDYNIEQQAEIARFVFLARCGAPASEAPPARALEALWSQARG